MAPRSAPTTWEEYVRELGIEFQRRRLAAGLTQEQLAHRAGMTRTHYQQIERGMWKPGQLANPSLKALVRLVQQLGIEVADVLPPSAKVSVDEA